MKRIGMAIASCAFASGAATAADLPSRKPAPPTMAAAPLLTWSGFYIGLNAGGTFGGNRSVNTTGVPVFADVATFGPVAAAAATATDASLIGFGGRGQNNIGFIGGGQIGWNWQFGSMVAGLETDIQGLINSGNGGGSSIVGAAPVPPPAGAGFTAVGVTTVNNKTTWLGTLRGRLGFLATPTFLLYGTGGLAYGGVRSNVASSVAIVPFGGVNGAVGAASVSTTRVGWTVGAGAEWMFAPNWSAKVEYLYYDLGAHSFNGPFLVQTVPGAGGAPITGDLVRVRVRNDGHTLRAGLNYHFNWGGPGAVVARY